MVYLVSSRRVSAKIVSQKNKNDSLLCWRWVPQKLMFGVLSPHLVVLFTEAVEFLRGGALLKEVYHWGNAFEGYAGP